MVNGTELRIKKKWLYTAAIAFFVPFLTAVIYLVTLWNEVGDLEEDKTEKTETVALSEKISSVEKLVISFDLEALRQEVMEVQESLESGRSELNVLSEQLAAVVDPLPPGTVIASILEPRIFLRDGRNEKWRLADAGVVPPNSLYATLVVDASIEGVERLPDLRGMFLRGLNVGRNDGMEDPDGNNRKAGHLQAGATKRPTTAFGGTTDMTGGHEHMVEGAISIRTAVGENFQRNKKSADDVETSSSGKHIHSVSIDRGGDAETRPRNVSVYYYIKIN